jgi:trehalose synthase-fused probable maltokinase
MPPASPTPDALVTAAAAQLVRELGSRRWFGAKTRTIAGVTPVDYASVPATAGVLALFRVDFAEPPAETYCVPLLAQPAAGKTGWTVSDAVDDPGFCGALVEQLAAGATLAARHGQFRFRGTAALTEMLPPPPRQVARIKAEQSNTSVVFGGRAILKIYRRLEAGPNPELEITDFLTGSTAFRAAPRLGGAIEYQAEAEEPITLATLHEFVRNQGDEWAALQARLGEYFAVAVTGPEAGGPLDPAFARALAAADAKEARALGQITGALHTALASASAPALAPEPIGASDVEAWQRDMEGQLDRVRDAVAASLDTLSGDIRDLAQRVLETVPQLKAELRGLQGLAAESVQKIRIHGDYHLGQVLRTEAGPVIVDFEGEPARPLAERRAKHCALRDVAGMTRSFAYAARAATLRAAEVAGGDSAVADRLAAWATAWEEGVRAAFMEGYLGVTQARGAGFLPSGDVLDAAQRVFELDKLVYEVGYEVNHRPSWARIPLQALLEVAAPAPQRAPAHVRAGHGPFSFVACLELREFVGARAEDERQLADLIEQAPLDSIYYHTHAFFLRHKFLAGIYPNDFATWVAKHLRDQVLGERLAMVDPGDWDSLEALRAELFAVIDDHLRQLQIVPRIVSAEPFDFVRSRIVEIPTGIEVRTLEEFRQALLEVDSSAIYFHVVEARVRLGRGQNDFAAWFEHGLGHAALAARVRALNPYTGSLERTRARLLQLCEEAMAEGTGR